MKSRPFSKGPEEQGVTPAILEGSPRGRPSSLSLFTQPLNLELLRAACGAQMGGQGVRSQGAEEVGCLQPDGG